jgi:hypothetical protein
MTKQRRFESLDNNGSWSRRYPTAMRADASTQVWEGHLPSTQVALENILMRAVIGKDEITMPERMLAHACELRCAIEAGGWHTRMHEDFTKLDTARFILNAMGAENLSDDLARTIDKLKAARSRQSERVLLRYLECRLLAEGAKLDAMIAQYAEKLPKHVRTSVAASTA